MIPSTVERVPLHTRPEDNAQITRRLEKSIETYATAGDAEIQKRLHELDEEWDIERTLEANAASVALAGLGLGAFVNRRFFALPAFVAGFLLQHAIQGWCPPLPLFRRLGFRTQAEIEQERYALKALRGDFQQIVDMASDSNTTRASSAMRAVRS